MRRARLIVVFLWVALLTLVVAPAALAHNPGGEGWYGPTTDQTITTAMFITIAFFPTVIVVFSLIQWWLDRRKHARLDAAKRRALNADWRGGW
jgi:uncharacterized membrane-anchored protein